MSSEIYFTKARDFPCRQTFLSKIFLLAGFQICEIRNPVLSRFFSFYDENAFRQGGYRQHRVATPSERVANTLSLLCVTFRNNRLDLDEFARFVAAHDRETKTALALAQNHIDHFAFSNSVQMDPRTICRIF